MNIQIKKLFEELATFEQKCCDVIVNQMIWTSKEEGFEGQDKLLKESMDISKHSDGTFEIVIDIDEVWFQMGGAGTRRTLTLEDWLKINGIPFQGGDKQIIITGIV